MAYSNFTRPGEIFSVLVEADGHDTVSRIERFFDSITVMYINVDVKNTLMIPTSGVGYVLYFGRMSTHRRSSRIPSTMSARTYSEIMTRKI